MRKTREELAKARVNPNLDLATARKYVNWLCDTPYAKCESCQTAIDLDALAFEDGPDDEEVITTGLNKDGEVIAWCMYCEPGD